MVYDNILNTAGLLPGTFDLLDPGYFALGAFTVIRLFTSHLEVL
jgi:hypothetical protein